jgi:hypothetical protein
MLLESQFQSKLIKKIKNLFPDCIIIKTDPGYIQGFPDLIILNGRKWAALEVKRSKNAYKGPNQVHWIVECDLRAYGSFVYPENEEEVLDELAEALQPY